MELLNVIKKSQDKQKTTELVLTMILNQDVILDKNDQEIFLKELKTIIPVVSEKAEISCQHFESIFFQQNFLNKN